MPPSNLTARAARLHRPPQMMLFAALVAWSFAATALATSAANGLAFRLRMIYGRSLLEACLQLFLLIVGFLALQGLARQGALLEEVTALPARPTAGQEWLRGAALGWGIVIAILLPLLLLRRLHAHLAFSPANVTVTLLALATSAVAILAHEMTFRGYPFRCLTRSIGPFLATAFMVTVAGALAWHGVSPAGTGVLASALLTLLLSLSWLRTHAIWLAWGIHFSLVASATMLFGISVERGTIAPSLVRSRIYGPTWLTGGVAGPIATPSALFVLVVALLVLYRVTRDYAWSYTHRPIVAAGAPVAVAAPAAHTAMEQQAAQAPGLVQILATTPSTFSASPAPAPPPIPEGLPSPDHQ